MHDSSKWIKLRAGTKGKETGGGGRSGLWNSTAGRARKGEVGIPCSSILPGSRCKWRILFFDGRNDYWHVGENVQILLKIPNPKLRVRSDIISGWNDGRISDLSISSLSASTS